MVVDLCGGLVVGGVEEVESLVVVLFLEVLLDGVCCLGVLGGVEVEELCLL